MLNVLKFRGLEGFFEDKLIILFDELSMRRDTWFRIFAEFLIDSTDFDFLWVRMWHRKCVWLGIKNCLLFWKTDDSFVRRIVELLRWSNFWRGIPRDLEDLKRRRLTDLFCSTRVEIMLGFISLCGLLEIWGVLR